MLHWLWHLIVGGASEFFGGIAITVPGAVSAVLLFKALRKAWRAGGWPAAWAALRKAARIQWGRYGWLAACLWVFSFAVCVAKVDYREHSKLVQELADAQRKASGGIEQRRFTLAQGQTQVTLSGDAGVQGVYLDGSRLTRDDDYSFSGNTLTLKYPALGGQTLDVDALRATN